MKNFMKKAIAKVTSAATAIKDSAVQAVQNNDGMEVVQVLIITIIAITLGALLLNTLEGQFTTQLGTVAEKMNGMFS